MRPPRKINVGLAKDSRKYFFIREEWPFADKGIWINRRLAYYGGIGRKMWRSFFLESAIQELALDKSQLLDTGLAGRTRQSPRKHWEADGFTVLFQYVSVAIEHPLWGLIVSFLVLQHTSTRSWYIFPTLGVTSIICCFNLTLFWYWHWLWRLCGVSYWCCLLNYFVVRPRHVLSLVNVQLLSSIMNHGIYLWFIHTIVVCFKLSLVVLPQSKMSKYICIILYHHTYIYIYIYINI